jgi:aminocarboxymuconate-semialdehyde decarboxylase
LPKKKPTQYLKDGQLYFDSIMFTGEGLRHLIAETGPDKVVIGTDYPIPWNRVPVDQILSTTSLWSCSPSRARLRESRTDQRHAKRH